MATGYDETEDLPQFVPTNSVIRRTDPLTYYKKQFVAEDKKQCRLVIELRNEENRIFRCCTIYCDGDNTLFMKARELVKEIEVKVFGDCPWRYVRQKKR